MRDLTVIEFLTLDGVMQSLASPDEDREGGFEYGGWSAPYQDEVIGKQATEGSQTTAAFLFGRKTYEHMAAHWPNQPDTDPMAAHLNSTPKYVVTRTLQSVDWAGTHVIDGDVVESVRELKAEGEGTIVVLGSGELVQTLIQSDLVDRFRLFLHPLVLGTGKRLFREVPKPLPLQLVDFTPTTTGVMLLSYER